ncbi:MAG: hypothetical protein R3F48_06160 [Candidatus Zixiibacteriota bacterium]
MATEFDDTYSPCAGADFVFSSGMEDEVINLPGYQFEKEGLRDGIEYKVFGQYDKFIGILARIDTRYHFLIRPERLTDKLFKAIGAEYEFQTGDKEFDRRLFIIGRENTNYQQALQFASVRDQILKLWPFREFFVGPNCIFLKLPVRNKHEFETIDSIACIDNLIKLGKTLRDIISNN